MPPPALSLKRSVPGLGVLFRVADAPLVVLPARLGPGRAPLARLSLRRLTEVVGIRRLQDPGGSACRYWDDCEGKLQQLAAERTNLQLWIDRPAEIRDTGAPEQRASDLYRRAALSAGQPECYRASLWTVRR